MSERRHTTHSTDDPMVGAFSPSRYRSRRGRGRAATTPHTHRFRTATAVLVGLGIAAVLVAVAVAVGGRDTRSTTTKWSSWSPTDQGNQGALDIASRVAPLYRLSPTQQLDVVTVVNLESAGAQAATAAAEANGQNPNPSVGLQVAVKPSAASSTESLLNGSTIAYDLCGTGARNCAIGVGTPSSSRLLLLRREALELALYTLKYLKGVEYVVTVLPPGNRQVTSALTKTLPTRTTTGSAPVDLALLFDRQELGPLLKTPLSATLPESFPPSVAQMSNAPEAPLVSDLTAHGLFSDRIQQAQDGSTLLTLTPLPPQ